MAIVDTSEAIQDGARLQALRDLHLLDVGTEEALDRFTHLATNLLQVPVSLLTLLDSDRQYFAAASGLDGDWEEDRQTPLSHSICKYVVAAKQPVVVEDARLDEVLRSNLAVRDLGVIAYAGMPLVLEDGNAVGALCAIDASPTAGRSGSSRSSGTSPRSSARCSTCAPGSPSRNSTTG